MSFSRAANLEFTPGGLIPGSSASVFSVYCKFKSYEEALFEFNSRNNSKPVCTSAEIICTSVSTPKPVMLCGKDVVIDLLALLV